MHEYQAWPHPSCPAAAASALLLGACAAVGPELPAPGVKCSRRLQRGAGLDTQAEPAAAGPKGEWWKAFNDPLLDELEPQGGGLQPDRAPGLRELPSRRWPKPGSRAPGCFRPSASAPRRQPGARSSTSAAAALAGRIEREQRRIARRQRQLGARPVGLGAPQHRAEFGERAGRARQCSRTPRCRNRYCWRRRDRVTDGRRRHRLAARPSMRTAIVACDECARYGRHRGDPAVGGYHRSGRAGIRRSRADWPRRRARSICHAIAVLVGKNPEDLDIPHGQGVPTMPRSRPGCPPPCLSAGPISPRPNAP